MFRTSRHAVLLTTASLAVGLCAVPGAAYAADTTTSLTQDQMTAELKKIAAVSTAAGKEGWRAALTGTGELALSAAYVVDRSHGRALEQTRYAGQVEAGYAVAGRGVYRSFNDTTSRSAVKMMGRPAVRYVFSARPSLKLDPYLEDTGAPTPAAVLTEDVQAGTRTAHDDGSADYAFSQDGVRLTLRVTASGVLSGAQVSQKEFTVKLTYAYGPQQVTLPSSSVTISSSAMNRGLAYVDMSRSVSEVANQGAADARRAARGHVVKVSSLRKIVRKDATEFNTAVEVKMVKVADVRGGARVYATNPWTHKTVSYTIKASGRKVTVRG